MSFSGLFRKVSTIGANIGAYFLAGIMLLVVASIIIRPFGRAISGSYELVELLIVVAIAFSFTYATLHQAHISVGLLMDRLKPRTQAIISIFTGLLSLSMWVIVCWANTDLMLDMWLREKSQFLEIPFLPFRIIWVFGLLLFCIALSIEVYHSIKKAIKQ